LYGRIDHQTSRRAIVCLISRHPFWQCVRRMIHALPIVIQKAGSPMIGLPARTALFVVVDVPLLRVFFRVEIEDQVCTWSSIFSCDPSPVDTTEVLIHIDQKLRLGLGVCSVYLCQFVADVAFRRCSTRDRTVLFEMQPNIEYGQTLRGSACPHLRTLFIHLKDSSKQANELLHEPHTASL